MAVRMVSTKPTAKYYGLSVAFASSVIFFFVARLAETISMSLSNPLQGMCVATSLVALVTLFTSPPVLTSSLIRRLGLVCLVLYSLKSEMDPTLTKLPTVMDLTNSVTIVTGANSGTGYSITQVLFERGATVIMACRSVEKCKHAAEEIERDVAKGKRNPLLTGINHGTMEVMKLDLGDLSSVMAFTSEFALKYDRVDVLVNNAGLIAPAGVRTAQGYEASLGVMHIGHFALTKWLMPLLLKPLPALQQDNDVTEQSIPKNPFHLGARIVNVGSQAYSFGYFDASLMEGVAGTGDLKAELTDNCDAIGPFKLLNCCPLMKCPVTNGYARAKLANLLHAFELQRRSDLNALQLSQEGLEAPRRIVTSVLHPGSVRTGIHWSLEAFGQFLRTSDQAAHLILHAIQSDLYLPGSYMDCMGTTHDLFNYREEHLQVHLKAYPSVVTSRLPFVNPPVVEFFSFEKWNFNDKNLIGWQSEENPPVFSSSAVAARLWDVTEHLVEEWKKENVA
jgi:NAD(P)-dependent dehydrogenase (short-subunit alcohol dehydrogenase family)